MTVCRGMSDLDWHRDVPMRTVDPAEHLALVNGAKFHKWRQIPSAQFGAVLSGEVDRLIVAIISSEVPRSPPHNVIRSLRYCGTQSADLTCQRR